MLGAGLIAQVIVGGALAGPSPKRTLRIRVVSFGQPNGASSEPRLSGDGRYVVFVSRATNFAGKPPKHIDNIYLDDLNKSAISLISTGEGNAGGDAPSSSPAVSGDGDEVVFASRASNLVAGTVGHQWRIYAWNADSGIHLISTTPAGDPAGGQATEPDVSADGRLIVFSSTGTDLVAGATDQRSNVYVRDTETGSTLLVSQGMGDTPANGASSTPAISPDGRYVSFYSKATNLVAGHTSGKGDVYLRDLATPTPQVVSRAAGSHGAEQNAAVAAPFRQISAVSAGGRYVAFDSDATNLVAHDHNHHTDVFVRDMINDGLQRASLATTDQEASSDSFSPRISADGRFVTFQSFAQNLVPYEPAGLNIFVRDLRRRTTVMADVSSHGRPRNRERVRQLLQRPSISDDGGTVAFASSATNLVVGDTRGVQDIFLRRLVPAPITFLSHDVGVQNGHLVLTFLSSDRQAGPLLCRIDHMPKALCPLGRTVLPPLRSGRHLVVAFPGGVGTAYATRPILVHITMRHGRARVRIKNPGSQFGIG
jgi:Tol biopolymer transport system component